MSKKVKEAKSEPSIEVAAFVPSSDELVEVQALRHVVTSLYGPIGEGKKGKIGAALAKQLEELGEVEIVKG